MRGLSASAIPVVGAGIGGLATALSLARAGFEVEIFDRAGTLSEVGAGLQLSPNALRVLDRLDVLGLVRASSVAAQSVALLNETDNRLIAEVPVFSVGSGYLAVHRADLQRALLEAVESEARIQLHLGTELTSLSFERGRTVLCFHQGQALLERAHPFAVAADGVRSTAVAALGLAPAKPTGRVADRFVVDAACLPGPAPSRIEAYLASGRHTVVYPLRSGRLINIVLIRRGEGDVQAPLPPLDDMNARLRELFQAAEPLGRWPLLSAPAARPLVHGGSLALVGDAGHAMPPFAAQGAAMAIEDAWVLARALSAEPDPRMALHRFEAERMPRLRRLRRRVSFHATVYHMPPPLAWARDKILSLRSPASLRADLSWLYDWQP